MKKITKFWRRLSYWQKGGIIGFLIPICLLVIGFLLNHLLFFKDNSINLLIVDIFYFPMGLFSYFFDLFVKKGVIECQSEACALGGYHMLIGLFAPIIYALIGIGIGLFIQRYNK
ncbi:MAG: hypothetical protein ISS25_03295 [Nanoarchaeota archaeon]|nr:hypothetical protein [DPANN group archaeon]MBL7116827.1 hypothetical protein [Nanoarchaeota archaeon]